MINVQLHSARLHRDHDVHWDASYMESFYLSLKTINRIEIEIRSHLPNIEGFGVLLLSALLTELLSALLAGWVAA
jgi:hypothetical protein